MKLYKHILILAAMAAMTSCYNDFGEVAPMKVYTQESFEAAFPECSYKTIEELKQIYAARTNDPKFEGGENSSWSDTKYWQFGSNPEVYGEEDFYIRGKVISNDEQGNIYKSLYLLDDTGAIEVRLTSGNYLKYYMGEWDRSYPVEIPTTYVYVRVKDLYIGNYRMMLSIGAGPTDSFNKRDDHKFYANSAIDSPQVIAEHVFVGESAVLRSERRDSYTSGDGVDIPVIDQNNYTTINGEAGRPLLGRLMLFRDITCTYAGVADQLCNKAKGIDTNIYPSWLYTDNLTAADNGILSKPWYDWAYSVSGKCLYGSVLFSYDPQNIPDKGITAGFFSLRTSGYSRFASRPTLKNGAVGNLLAIYAIYSKSWTYSFGAYQVSVSRVDDIMFDENDYLTPAVAQAMTPDGGNGEYVVRNPLTQRQLAYSLDEGRALTIDNTSAAEANLVRPGFLTRYADENTDKFMNYPSYGATRSAIMFKAGEKTFVLKVDIDGMLTTEEVTLTASALDYNEAYEFLLTQVDSSQNLYTITHGSKYLSPTEGAPALTDTACTWRIAIPSSNYDSGSDSYYVPWVGEEDDEIGGGME